MTKQVRIDEIKDRDGTVLKGVHADIEELVVEGKRSKCIRLFGTKPYPRGNEPDDAQFVKLFTVGDYAEYGSFNLTYYGTIVAITDKTVTIEERWNNGGTHKLHRLSLYKFANRNWDFDLAEVDARNAETSRSI